MSEKPGDDKILKQHINIIQNLSLETDQLKDTIRYLNNKLSCQEKLITSVTLTLNNLLYTMENRSK